MGVGEDDGLQVIGLERQRGAVAQPQLLVALKQAAVHQQALAVVLNQKFGAGHGAGPAEKGDLNAHAPISPQTLS